jgi:hypothetical protein
MFVERARTGDCMDEATRRPSDAITFMMKIKSNYKHISISYKHNVFFA